MTDAGLKWIQIAFDVIDYEMQHSNGDGQLLSEAADRWIAKHPVAARVCIVSVGALLTLHLANLIDKDYDVVSRTFWRKRSAQFLAWRRKTF